MVHRVALPLQYDVGLSENIIDAICLNAVHVIDIINLSLVNKQINKFINENNNIWINYCKKLGIWCNGNDETNNIIGIITPLNCLDIKINDPFIAKNTFIKIYSLLSPIVKQLLIDNYTNFQNLTIFNTYNTPILQAKLFSNIGNFIIIMNRFNNYDSLIIRFNSIINLFINSIINEIQLQLKFQNYSNVLSLITALDCLNISNERINIDPLDSLLEFFISKYNDDYINLLTDNLSNECFQSENNNHNTSQKHKRGIVKGYSFSFEKVDEIFNNITEMLNNQLIEIDNIFKSSDKNLNRSIDEIPIILKVLENFLSNYLIGGLIDKIIFKSKQIDSYDDGLIIKEKVVGDGQSKEEGIENIDNDNNNNNNDNNDNDNDLKINLINETSLFFQCVPYLHYKLIKMLENLKYPKTEILLESNETINMNYIKVSCEFINYYYEQYLIEFSIELPRKCHQSLIQLIQSWKSDNQKFQKNIEFEILKLVINDDNENNNKKSNYEIINTFTNLFTFNNKQKEIKDEPENNENKLTKMEAKLKILSAKVESLKNLISLDLTILLLQHIKNSYDLLIGLTEYSITVQLKKQINETCQNIFSEFLNILINQHIKPGFQEALNRLNDYKPIEQEEGLIEPVNKFIELVEVGDLILQMIDVFYKNELINNGIISNGGSKDFLKMNGIEKSIKLFENILDTYVANGLDISINIIVNEIKFKIENKLGGLEVLPQSQSSNKSFSTIENGNNDTNNDNMVYNLKFNEELRLNTGLMSEWTEIYINVLNNHFKLLQESIEKSIMEVFKQELGERLIIYLIKLILKKFKISVIGGIQFNYDINKLYEFYKINKIKPAIDYLIGFKKINQLYLIDCLIDNKNNKEIKLHCKELGKLIIEIGRDNGIFTPEEVYQFVSRRSDWYKIKKNIDKVVYGFGADDCVIM